MNGHESTEDAVFPPPQIALCISGGALMRWVVRVLHFVLHSREALLLFVFLAISDANAKTGQPAREKNDN